MLKCPDCQAVEVSRIYRPRWMKLIPLSRHQRCGKCGYEYMSFAGLLAYRKPFARVCLVVVIFLLAAWLVLGQEGAQRLWDDLYGLVRQGIE